MHLTEIYDQYYLRVKKFIWQMVRNEWLADDLVQDTFIRINNNLGKIRSISSLQAWIFRIAYNICRDYFRNRAKSPTWEDNEIYEGTASNQKIQDELEQYQMRKCIQNQINQLPESLRSILILFDLEGFSHQEIASITSLTVDNVKVRVHRARKKLKVLLEEHCTFEIDDRNVLTCAPILSAERQDEWSQYLP